MEKAQITCDCGKSMELLSIGREQGYYKVISEDPCKGTCIGTRGELPPGVVP